MALPSDFKVRRCVEWCAELPYSDRPRESPVFVFQGFECCFRFFRELCTDWRRETRTYFGIRLQPKGKVKPFRPVSVQTYAGYGKEGTFKLPSGIETVSSSRELIWSAEESAIKILKPDPYFGNFLSFLFVFDDPVGPILMSKTETGNKLVQTASYFKANPCLESLSDDFRKLLEGSSNHDAELKCGDHTVKAHRTVLSARSEVFEAMLESDMVEGRTGLVKIRDMDAAIFQAFVRYLYTGTLPELTWGIAKKFYEAGDKYAVRGLMRRCSGFLIENLTLNNACEFLSLADDHSDQDFKENVIAYILDKRIPLLDDHWPAFCRGHPALALDVMNRFCKLRSTASLP